ncbi:MAG: FAD/NAD(P)-binding protein [Pseudomonadota bacterium]
MDAAVAVRADLTPRPVKVIAAQEVFASVATLTFQDKGFAAAPGQFMMVGRPGYGEVPISVSGLTDDGFELTIRAEGAASQALVRAKAGDWMGVRGPYGTRWPAVGGGDLLIMAGGLGLAPLRLAFLQAVDAGYDRVILLYGARDPSTIVFTDELDAWMEEGRASVHVTVDTAGPGWTGNVGLITTLLDRNTIDPARTTALVCGPEVMMRLCARRLEAEGVPAQRIHISLERHMACGTGACGRCQLGPLILCRDGAVVRYDRIAHTLSIPEI